MEMYSCMPNNDTVDFWIKNKMNVLFYGRHGVGKTSMILDGFERNKIKYLQFSAATMDPWVDFIGVPKEMKDEKGSYLDLIRPKTFRDDEIEALFFDELNRSHKKVRNAVMELIQFKSINGKKFPHLKMIWGAVNPEDDDAKYDVEKLDPAQADRFHVHVEIPYKPYVPYFREKYGRNMAQAAIDWWNELPPNLKLEVSPRRLEYAIQCYMSGGNLLHILSPKTNVDKLEHSLKNGSPIRDFRELIAEGDEQKIKDWLQIENNYSAVQPEIIKHPSNSLHLLSEERLCSLIAINSKIMDYVFTNTDKYIKIIEVLAKDSQNKKMQLKASSVLASRKQIRITGNSISLPKTSVPSTVIRRASRMINYKWNDLSDVTFKKNVRRYYNLDPNLIAATSSAAQSPRQTPERLRICHSVIKIVETAKIMSEAEAQTALNLLDWVANKTQSNTIKKRAENIIPTINKCVTTIRTNNPKFTTKDFVSSYPGICGRIINQVQTVPLNGWCIIP